jgi:hypothetical protein
MLFGTKWWVYVNGHVVITKAYDHKKPQFRHLPVHLWNMYNDCLCPKVLLPSALRFTLHRYLLNRARQHYKHHRILVGNQG